MSMLSKVSFLSSGCIEGAAGNASIVGLSIGGR